MDGDCAENINNIYSVHYRDRAPGQAECDEAIEKINQSIRDLDSASLEAMGSNLPPMEGNNFQVGILTNLPAFLF